MRGTTNAQTIGGTVGSDTKPVKIVDGKAVAVANDLLAGKISEIWDSGSGHIAVKFNTINGATLGIETGYVTGTVPAGSGIALSVNLHYPFLWGSASVSIASANPYYAELTPTAYRSGNQFIVTVWNRSVNDSTQAFAWTIIGFIQ